jgi:hypothetical protein
MVWDLLIRPIQCWKPLPQGLIEGAVAWFCINQQFNWINNWTLWPLVFSMNHLPVVKKGGQNGIHCQWRAPIKYKQVNKNYENNYLTVIWLLATVMGDNKIDNETRCRKIAGNFDHHGDPLMWSGAHCPMKHIKASLKATGCCHQASVYVVSPRQLPWSQCLRKTQNTNIIYF